MSLTRAKFGHIESDKRHGSDYEKSRQPSRPRASGARRFQIESLYLRISREASERTCVELHLALRAALYEPKASAQELVYPGGHSVSIVLTTNYHDPDADNERLAFGCKPSSSAVDQRARRLAQERWHAGLWKEGERARSWAYTRGPSGTLGFMTMWDGPQSPFHDDFPQISREQSASESSE